MNFTKNKNDILELYKISGKTTTKNYYSKYGKYFKAESIDLKDLEQEVICELLMFLDCHDDKLNVKNSRLPEDILIKKAGKTVKFFLMDKLNLVAKRELFDDGIYAFYKDKDLEPIDIINKLLADKVISKENKQYDVFYKKFVEEKTESQIAKELKIEKHRVRHLYAITLKRAEDANSHVDASHNNNDEDKENYYLESKRFSDNQVTAPTVDFVWDNLKNTLDDKSYKVLYLYIIEEKSFVEIGKELNFTKQRVEQIYKKNIEKLRKTFKKELD